jgi:hypothetical protein
VNYIECDIPEGLTLADYRRSRMNTGKRSWKHPFRRTHGTGARATRSGGSRAGARIVEMGVRI